MAHMALWSSVCFCRLLVGLLYCILLFLIAGSDCGFLLSGFAQGGATYYVAPTGGDSNPGTSAAPWRTIQKAANTLNGGDTVIVNAGTYNERVQVVASGTAGKLLNFQAQGTVVMQGFNVQGNYVRVNGFEITNAPGSSSTDRTNGSGFYVSSSNNEISNNYVHNIPAAGISLTSSVTNTTVSGNRVAYAVECGLYISGSGNLIASNDISHTRSVNASAADGVQFFGSGNTIRKNYIHDLMLSDSPGQSPDVNAFMTWGPATNYILERNLIDKDSSEHHGIDIEAPVQPVGDIIIRNNVFITRGTGWNPTVTAGSGGTVTNITIVNNTMAALNGPAEYAVWLLPNVRGAVFKNNALYDHGTSYAPYIQVDPGASGVDIGFNSVSKNDAQTPTGSPYPGDLWMANPDFVNLAGGDFHLRSGSSLINQGTTLSQVTNDYDGVSRPQGAGYDIGAYEAVVVNPPTITSLTPTSGPVGFTVTINGTNFSGATAAVRFNGVGSTFMVNSATAIQATVPAGATTGPISVITPGGTATSSGNFTIINLPTIAGFTPASGTVGNSVTISGTNFTGATAVQFNSISATFTVNSSTTIQAMVPAATTTGPISVTTLGGTATSGSNFIVNNPPTITSFTPAMGPAGAGVSITGTDFSGATAVQFNGASATFTVNSPSSIQATVPAAATTGPISVTTAAGTGTSSTVFKPATRFEDTDPAVTTTSGWNRSTLRPWSGGMALVASTAGAQATFTFTGTDLRWVGFRGAQAGIARVSLDGVFIQQIDMYAAAEAVQAEVFKTTGLALGNHTLMIEATGTNNPNSTGTYVVVDAFDVAPAVPATVSITSPPSGTSVSGTIMITVTVSGGTVAGVQYRLDGANLGAEVATFPYSLSWDTTTAGSTSHTLSAVARFAAGNTATSSPVGVTLFNSPPGQTRFEDTDPSITFTAGWIPDTTSRPWSGGSAKLSTTAGARATFTFSGTSAYWIGFRGPQAGIARVSVDGVVASDVDAYSSFEQVQSTLFQATGLAAGTHTLTIEVTGTSNPASTNTYIVVDAFDDAQQVSQVFIENQQQGSANWQMWLNGYRNADDINKQVKGYASATSLNKGGSITFYVTVNPVQTFTMDVYRMGWYQGRGGRLLQHIGPLAGVTQSPCPVDGQTGLSECSWTSSYVLTVPTTWTSGVFLVQLTNAQGYQNYIPFVVRDDARHSDILYQQSVTTYQAYNNFPNDGTGKSLYEYNSNGANTVAGTPRAVKVSFNRPYSSDWGGSGDFLQWEYYFIRWLERSGYDVSYSTDVDTHENSSRLLNSKAFVAVGHDEYWSNEMYDGVEGARNAGVHLGFFSGDTLSWQIRFEPSPSTGAADRVMVCYKDRSIDPIQGPTTTITFHNPFINRSGQILRGVRNAGQLAGAGPNYNVPYVVTNSSNWVYTRTGLVDGDSVPGIVGYEADAQAPSDPTPNSVNGTYVLLSQSPFTDTGNRPNRANSSIYQALSGAWVFSAGTISWSWGLDRPGVADPRIQRITANVLNRFLRSSP